VKRALRQLGEPYASAAERGLRALGRHAGTVSITDTRRLTGSIDLDACLARDARHANAPRWDYGVGFRAAGSEARCAVWIEVHGASQHGATEVLRKAAWLRRWLAEEAPSLQPLTATAETALGRGSLQWVATGRVAALAIGGSTRRAMAEAGLDMPVRRLRIG
jgi:hypothetical protein